MAFRKIELKIISKRYGTSSDFMGGSKYAAFVMRILFADDPKYATFSAYPRGVFRNYTLGCFFIVRIEVDHIMDGSRGW